MISKPFEDIAVGDTAVMVVDADGRCARYTFGEVTTPSLTFGAVLAGLGVDNGDRIGVMVPQGIEVVIAHLGAFRSAVVTVPCRLSSGSTRWRTMKQMRSSGVDRASARGICRQAAATGEEPWAKRPAGGCSTHFDIEINEFFGLTEIDMTVGTARWQWTGPARLDRPRVSQFRGDRRRTARDVRRRRWVSRC